jgi:hypothetical protein
MNTLFMKKLLPLGMLAIVLTGTLASGTAEARGRVWRHEEWGRGRWVHDRHGGRLGWWWVVGPSWVWYERPHTFVTIAPPVVVEQTPPVVIQQTPPVVVQQTPAYPPPPPPAPAPVVTPVMYYCKATGTHYPETMSCPGGWMTMTAETPPVPAGATAPAIVPPTEE